MVSYSLSGHWGSFKALSVYRKGNFVTGCLTVPLWRLELYAVKVARTVLRREAPGNRCRLSDKTFLKLINLNCDHQAILSNLNLGTRNTPPLQPVTLFLISFYRPKAQHSVWALFCFPSQGVFLCLRLVVVKSLFTTFVCGGK